MITKSRWCKVILQVGVALVIVAAVILPRVFDLGRFQTADEKRWLSNTVDFITNLAHWDWQHLMIQPHPGITTQWLASSNIWSDSWSDRKMPLAAAQIVLIGIITYLFWRLFDAKTAALTALLLGLDPLLIAHTRILAMDSLLAHFLLISLASILLWRQNGRERYLIFSGLTGAAVIWSKLPGLIIVPLALGVIILKGQSWRMKIKAMVIWVAACLGGMALILPSFVLNPLNVINDIRLWLQSDDFVLHQMGPFYYLRSIVFFSTPGQLVALAVAPFILLTKTVDNKYRRHFLIFICAAILFAVLMSFSGKKGDRYILPSFVFLDIAAAILISWIFSLGGKNWALLTARVSFILLITMQLGHVILLHPYTLAYVNPITQPIFGERRLGWGEGLDLAADYLNQKTNAANLTAASYYPNEFASYFHGETVPLHQHDEDKVDYAVIYRAMFERGPDAWETDVVNYYRGRQPEKIITITGTDLVWIYRK